METIDEDILKTAQAELKEIGRETRASARLVREESDTDLSPFKMAVWRRVGYFFDFYGRKVDDDFLNGGSEEVFVEQRQHIRKTLTFLEGLIQAMRISRPGDN